MIYRLYYNLFVAILKIIFLSRMYLEERTAMIELTIVRELGTFGRVKVFVFADSPADGAIKGKDFDFEAKVNTCMFCMF